MKKGILSVILLLLLGISTANAQGIQFFKGSFEEVFKKAQAEKKKVFIDFYTVWCGPCKLMSKEVFPDAEVGAYFNEKFISYQINAEDKAFAAQVSKYKIEAYPGLVITDASGVAIATQFGALDKAHLIKFAKMANGEVLGFKEMYDKLKTDKNNDQLVQALLLEAPDFMVKQEPGSNYDRWSLRIERLYADYRKKKPLADMMNPTDFAILMTYHIEADKNDEILNYIMKNYDSVVRAVGQNSVYKYVFTLNTMLLQNLARKGDMDYLKCLERLKGDMKPVYDSLMNFNGADVYTGMKYMYDGEYYIYNKKDFDTYFSLMDKYFSMLGTTIKHNDYRSAINAVFEALEGKLTPKVCTKFISWITLALQQEVPTSDQMELLIMAGDCYKTMQDKENAKKCYNQAYVLSLQFNNPGLSAAVKQYLTGVE